MAWAASVFWSPSRAKGGRGSGTASQGRGCTGAASRCSGASRPPPRPGCSPRRRSAARQRPRCCPKTGLTRTTAASSPSASSALLSVTVLIFRLFRLLLICYCLGFRAENRNTRFILAFLVGFLKFIFKNLIMIGDEAFFTIQIFFSIKEFSKNLR